MATKKKRETGGDPLGPVPEPPQGETLPPVETVAVNDGLEADAPRIGPHWERVRQEQEAAAKQGETR